MADSSEALNIVMVVIDTLRADHLGCYGYGRPTSPNIDSIAEHSVVFTNAHAAGIPTTPSLTALLSGLHPLRSSIVAHPSSSLLAEDVMLLPQLAKKHGYVTAACDNMVVQGGGSASWFARGYDQYRAYVYSPFTAQSEQLTDSALRFIQRMRDRKFLLYIHYWDPHSPYVPLPPFDKTHNAYTTNNVNLREIVQANPDYYVSCLEEMRLDTGDTLGHAISQYDGSISQVDAQVGRLVNQLRTSDVWDNTIFVLSADHGECFGEGGLYFDHQGLFDAVTRIALLLKIPSIGPQRVDALISEEDLLPTICDLAQLERPAYELTGTSLLPLLGRHNRTIREEVVSTESCRQASISLRTLSQRLIRPIAKDAANQDIPDIFGKVRKSQDQWFTYEQASPNAEQVSTTDSSELASRLARLERQLSNGTEPIQSQGLGLPYDKFLTRVKERLARDVVGRN